MAGHINVNTFIQHGEDVELNIKNNDEECVEKKDDISNAIIDKHNIAQASYSYAEIRYTKTRNTCYLEAYTKPKWYTNISHYLTILTMLDVVVLVIPWIWLFVSLATTNAVLIGRKDVSLGPIECLLNHVPMLAKLPPKCVDKYELDGTFFIPFNGYELRDIAFVSQTTFFVALRHPSHDFNKVIKIDGGNSSLVFKSPKTRSTEEPVRMKYFKSQNALYLSLYKMRKTLFIKVSLKGTILEEFEFKRSGGMWCHCLLEGPLGNAYIASENGVMELDSRKFLFTYKSTPIVCAVFLEKFDMFVIDHFSHGYIAGYYKSGSLVWTHKHKTELLSPPSKTFTLAPGGKEVLYLDHDHDTLLFIDHTGKVTLKMNLLILLKTHISISSVNDVVMIALRSCKVFKLKRKKRC